MLKYLHTIFLLISLSSYAQLVDYEIKIVEIMATADASDLQGQDPTWYIWFKDNGTNGSAITSWVPTGCIYLEDNNYGSWFSGTPNQGPSIPFSWQIVTGTDATQIQTQIEGFEKDCPNDCSYDGSCYWGTIDDDNHDNRANSGNIDFTLDPPCQWNQYEIANDDYHVRVEIYWTFSALDAGEIDGEQYVCMNGDPTVLGSVLDGEPAVSNFATYQWQQSLGCTGAFVDIPGATNSTYDPPLGLIQNTCFRRKVLTSCDEAISNEVVVGIEVPSVAATSITATPASLCGAGNVTLSVNGGTLGSNADWYWYDNDPNSNGNLIGTGDPLTINVSSTSTFYVRAEGNCSVTPSVSKLVVVENPSNPPTTLTPTSSSICLGGSTDLTATGGVLGTNAVYAWYDQDPNLGSPLPIHTSSIPSYIGVSPATTTTYYVRIEGCDTTTLAYTTVVVTQPSTAPTGITASNTTVCPNDMVTLTVTGGSLGDGADWYWYESGCGAGTVIGSGATINVNPTVTTNYFVRAEGLCNTTNCMNITIVVNDESVPPASIVASATSVCPGGVSVLSVVGGNLGTGADWYWYESSCGGTPIGTGNSISVNPTVTTDYFVRAEGSCNTTSCATVSINVKAISVDATGITVSNNNICSGSTTTLSVSGGSLGVGATWEWYTGSCGGVYLGSGAILSVSPTVTTTYYVRAEGDCNTSGCVNTTVTVLPTSTLPTSILVSNPNVCPNSSTDLTVVGGNLVNGDNWTWYEGGCGLGTAIGTGSTINVSPTASTEYFVRGEGTCGFTNCASVTVNTDEISTAPNEIVATSTALCVGQSTVLSVSGGNLGSGASWQWYSGSCGSNPVGSGNSISVAPSATTTYYVRGEGNCGNSSCVNITIDVGAGVDAPTSANVSTDNICPSETTTISVVGSTLPSDYTWVWYTGACGAVPVGVGTSLDVSPTSTETYYVRAVGTCGATPCQSITVNVQNGSVAATGVQVSNNNFCQGATTTLTVVGGSLVSGANWVWYENSCGGSSPVGTGTSVTLTPNNSTSYYVRAEGGTCGSTDCASAFVSVIETIVHCNPFDTLCGIGFPFALEGGEPDGGVYSGNGVSNGIFSPDVAGIGTHTITYTYTSPISGCTNSVDKEIVVKSSDLTATIVTEEFPCSQGGVTLSALVKNNKGFLDYLWSNGSYDESINFVGAGTYSVQVRDDEGCVAKSDEVVISDEMECIDIPNTFTPNGDGKNDTWNLDFTDYESALLTVFSRWGREVYKTSELEVHWNGTSKSGTRLPAGVYYYVLELNGGDRKQNGTITLLR